MSANSQSLSTRARNFAPARCYCFPFSLSASTFSVPSPQRLNLSPSLTPYASRFTPCLLSPQSWLPPESLASRVCSAFRKERNRRSDATDAMDSIDAIDATDPMDATTLHATDAIDSIDAIDAMDAKDASRFLLLPFYLLLAEASVLYGV